MRGFLAAPALIAACIASAGSALASPAMTAVPTVMRAGPSSHAAAVQSIPANAQIEVVDCDRYWCQASWRNLGGFVRVSALGPGPGGPPPDEAPYAGPGPVVIAPPPVVVAPYYGWGWHGGWGGGYGYGWRHY